MSDCRYISDKELSETFPATFGVLDLHILDVEARFTDELRGAPRCQEPNVVFAQSFC